MTKASKQSNSHNYRGQRFLTLLNFLIEPPASIKDPEMRSQARLLNSLLVFFTPLAFVVAILHNSLTVNAVPIFQDQTIYLAFGGIAILLVTYFVNRAGHFLYAVRGVLLVGSMLIVLSATLAEPPTFEMAFLIVILLVGSIVLSLRETITLGASLLGFTVLWSHLVLVTQSQDHYKDVIIYMMIVSTLIVLITYQRNRLETDRNKRLVESEAQLRLLTGQLPALCWTTDKLLHILSITGSESSEFKIMGDTLVNPTLSQLFADDGITRAHLKALKNKSSKFEIKLKDIPYQCHIEPLYDTEHNLVGCIGIALNISHQRQMKEQEQELVAERERVRALSEFIEHVSHDFRTPLSVINSSLYLLEKQAPENRQRYTERIEEQATRMNDLLDSFLMMARFDRDFAPEFESLSIPHMLQQIADNFQTVIEDCQLTLTMDIEDTLPLIQVDPQELYRALSNLVSNAIQHSPAGNTLYIDVYQQVDAICIEVKDEGEGILAHDLPHIFERFYRADKSRSSIGGGAGLGLPIARKIVEAHGGIIEVTSVAGKGSTFRITLPIMQEQPLPVPSLVSQ